MGAVTAAVIAGVATVGAAKMQSDASKDAASAQGAAGNAAMLEQRAARDQFQENITPYLSAGQNALGGLNALSSGDYSGFQDSPDYLWAQQQGLQAQDRSAAARGGLYSGGHQADLQAFGQGLATQQLGTYRNHLLNMAQLGQSSAVGAGAAGQTNANALSGILMGQGQAQADGAMNRGNVWGGALNGLAGLAGQYGTRQSSYQPQTPYSSNVLANNTVQVGGGNALANNTAFGNNRYRGGK
ncbi:hypothetical protein [Luteimonas terrae]|uniref:DNA transfer protein p32 n=1 Tax=Luteimonas terrae TaxID=1530191 RepID=A0ABU1XVC8_9GAMM|nr:hypothetical protein [Luteimonas terrae]MDR7192704.1 hypothetical protein [Luteimonas terrae]